MVDETYIERGRKLKNYKVIEEINSSRRCIVYCSSNNIYYPDDDVVFDTTILRDDRYEWMYNSVKNVKKSIYVRDIYKAWYVCGINEEINNIEKLVAFLKEETRGYDVTIIGNSAGGYCAIVLGAFLNAECVMVFSPQNNLDVYSAYWKCPYLSEEQLNNNEFKDLNKYISNYKGSLFYFYSVECREDIEQVYSLNRFENVYLFPMDSKWHGKNVYPFNMHDLIQLSVIQLKELHSQFVGDKKPKKISKFIFSVKLVGIPKTTKRLINYYIQKGKRG